MRRTSAVVWFLLSLSCVGAASAEQRFLATLTGAQEVPPVTTSAGGTGTVVLNAAETEITVNLTFSGLTANVTGAHIHGPVSPGSNGPIVFNLSSGLPAATAGTIAPVTFAITSTQAAQLKGGQFYFNVHSATFPGGEIRGQILPAPHVKFEATLSGAQEVPPVSSSGSGSGAVFLNGAETQISVDLSFSGLSSNASGTHIHGAAPPGVNAPVIFNLTGAPAATSGTVPRQNFAITAAQVAQLRDGQFYFNVHTTMFPGGEVRGQVGLAPVYVRRFDARLDGEQRVPSVATPGSGSGSVRLHAGETEVTVNLQFGGLSSHAVAAHIHESDGFGRNGPIAFDLTGVTPSAPTGAVATQVLPVTAAQVSKLKSGLLYFDVHTTNHSGGEIRGQLVAAPTRRYRASLTGDQEVPPQITSATGSGEVILNETEDQIRARATFSGLTEVTTAAHIHGPAGPGVNGPVIFPFAGVTPSTSGIIADQTFAISTTQVAQLQSGQHYFNVHTVSFPGGEIRGQIGVLPLLTVAYGGTGSSAGTITSAPGGIACGGDCVEAYDAGTTVQLLKGTASAGSTFRGWTGGGCQGLTCSVTLQNDTTVTAIYTLDASAIQFTDDPIVPGTTPVKAAHVVELRNAINSLRTANGLGAFSFTDSVGPGTQVKAIHVSQLRQALDAVYAQRHRPLPSYTLVSFVPRPTIRALEMNELRAAVRLIE